jgi:heme a synthase
MPALARFAWTVLAYNVAVIAWGAYVRATGSGAGCGEHWPLCNGEILPRSPGVATLIEFSHRVTSGLALLGVLALLIWTFRRCRRGDHARLWAGLSMLFILTEAAVGAGLVLFQLVADNASAARGMFMAVHLLNTFLLLGALTLTAWLLSRPTRLIVRDRVGPLTAAVAGAAALLLAGASGAVAALGDTLFPSATLGEALQADLSVSSHLLIRLRILHPVIAVGAGFAVVALARSLAKRAGQVGSRLARALTILVAAQFGLGLVNVVLLAPVWLQLVHLLMADAIWVAFVILGADAVAEPAPASSASVKAA